MILTNTDIEVLLDALQMYTDSYKDYTGGAKNFKEKQKLAHMTGLRRKIDRYRIRTAGTLMTREEAAEYLSIGMSTLDMWTKKYNIPCIKLGGRNKRYKLEDLKNFIKSQEEQTQ